MKHQSKGFWRVLVIALAMLLCIGIGATAANTVRLPGDMDWDGAITPADARIVLRIAVALEKVDDYMEKPNDTDPAEALVSDAFIDPIGEWQKYDDMVAQIKKETDLAKRTALMHQAEDVLMSNYCVIPIYYYNDIYLQKSYVKGVYSTPNETKYFMNASMTNGSNKLRLYLAGEPITLDPALNTTVDGATLAANSFAGLYTYDANGNTVPACAEKYTVSKDGLTYTVTLKKNLKWSDGSPLTAADFAYSWKRAAAPQTGAIYEYMFSGFEGYEKSNINVTAVNDTTLRFVLTAPCAYMEDLMAFPAFYPVKKAAVESAADWRNNPGAWCEKAGFVSNGAFVCTEWNHDVSMTYTKNPYYYNADKVAIDKLELMQIGDDFDIYAAYQAGDLDFTDSCPTDEIASLLQAKNRELHIVDELGTYYIAFNAQSSLFEGKTPAQAACMREAISLLIDRDYICDNIGQTCQVAANSFIPLGMADGNGGLFHNGADGYYNTYAINNDANQTLAKARKLLEAAGYEFGSNGKLSKSTPLTIEYLTNDSSGHVAIAEAIQFDLSELGIKMTIESEDWLQFLSDRGAGNFTFARGCWIADFNDPINMLEMFTTDSGNNYCRFGK